MFQEILNWIYQIMIWVSVIGAAIGGWMLRGYLNDIDAKRGGKK